MPWPPEVYPRTTQWRLEERPQPRQARCAVCGRRVCFRCVDDERIEDSMSEKNDEPRVLPVHRRAGRRGDPPVCEHEQDDLKPWGNVLSGQPGVSAPRIANALGVPVGVVKRLAAPVGRMKMAGRNPFDAYDPALAEQMQELPEVTAARARKAARSPSSALKAAQTRRERVAEHLCRERQDLKPLYQVLVKDLWSPSSERALLNDEIYSELPALLWDALRPKPEAHGDATTIVVDILWAVLKQHTWKVNESGGQDLPLVLQLWADGVPPHRAVGSWGNVFAAAIRHLWHNDGPKMEGREKALARLRDISARKW